MPWNKKAEEAKKAKKAEEAEEAKKAADKVGLTNLNYFKEILQRKRTLQELGIPTNLTNIIIRNNNYTPGDLEYIDIVKNCTYIYNIIYILKLLDTQIPYDINKSTHGMPKRIDMYNIFIQNANKYIINDIIYRNYKSRIIKIINSLDIELNRHNPDINMHTGNIKLLINNILTILTTNLKKEMDDFTTDIINYKL